MAADTLADLDTITVCGDRYNRREFAHWLERIGVDPHDVPINGIRKIRRLTRTVQYDEYVRDDGGSIVRDRDGWSGRRVSCSQPYGGIHPPEPISKG